MLRTRTINQTIDIRYTSDSDHGCGCIRDAAPCSVRPFYVHTRASLPMLTAVRCLSLSTTGTLGIWSFEGLDFKPILPWWIRPREGAKSPDPGSFLPQTFGRRIGRVSLFAAPPAAGRTASAPAPGRTPLPGHGEHLQTQHSQALYFPPQHKPNLDPWATSI